ncbi:MAG: ABC transporter substrate-binding protein [Nitrospinota bacterium]|nr:MAG: ABC transporter substrate-binding protein [Nitrospinota bacterium]
MKSRDGFTFYNQLLEKEVNRRTFLRLAAGGLAAAGTFHLGLPWSLAATPRTFDVGTPKYGGTITIGLGGNPDTLDPHHTSYLLAIKIHSNIYNGILKITYDGKNVRFEPDLAKEWEIKEEKIHTFRFHQGVHFHNGDELTAEGVKWSLERVMNPAEKSFHAWKLAAVEKLEVLDKYTLRMTLKHPDPFLPVALTGSTGRAGTIVNRRAVEQYGKEYGHRPVGTGPFKFVEWVENSHITLERNPDYFEKDGAGNQLPFLDRVHIKIIEEESSRIAAIETGEIDGMDSAPYQFVSRLRQNPKLNVYTQVGGNYWHLSMHCGRPPFNNKTLRQAVAFAIDRDAFIKAIFFGEAIPAHAAISPPMTDFWDPELESDKNGQYYDLEKAKALVKKSGYDGREAIYVAQSWGNGPRRAQVLQAMLARAGIRVKLTLNESASWRKRWRSGDYDLIDFGWWADLDPDETLYPEWRSGEKWNFGQYSNPEFDRLVDAARRTIDVAKRRELYSKAQRILVEDAPCAFIAHVNEHKVFAKYVRGFNPIPADLIDMHSVWLEKA